MQTHERVTGAGFLFRLTRMLYLPFIKKNYDQLVKSGWFTYAPRYLAFIEDPKGRPPIEDVLLKGSFFDEPNLVIICICFRSSWSVSNVLVTLWNLYHQSSISLRRLSFALLAFLSLLNWHWWRLSASAPGSATVEFLNDLFLVVSVSWRKWLEGP